MIKLVYCFAKRPDLSFEEFSRYWRDVHGPIGARIPGVRRLVQSVALRDTRDAHPPGFDGMVELWFDDRDALLSARSSPEWHASAADERHFLDHTRTAYLVTEERILVDSSVAGGETHGAVAYTHGMADIEPGLRLHYVAAGDGARTIVLLHGFPQTWWEWHHVIPPLVAAGYRVIAPDYRGAGQSWRPHGGYDKRTMAEDVHRLVRRHLGVEGRIVLVGHDIGLMVAYAYAQAHRDEVSHLVIADAPLPGTIIYDRLRSDVRVWHFAFHTVRDIPEMLVAGREREYLQAFFNVRCFNTAGITDADLDIYTAAYSAPGAMRAGFEVYRAFDRDAEDNREALRRNGKLPMPVLAVGGAISTSGALVEEMMREVADNVTGLRVPGTAHWIPEENPKAFVEGLLRFLEGATEAR